MIDLRDYVEPIAAFLDGELAAFRRRHPDIVSPHIALYSCPWSGWVSLCLDSEPQVDQNCPDFELVEFALFEAPAWGAEYEEHAVLEIVGVDGTSQVVDTDLEGDEGINRVFFEFLRSVLASERTEASLVRLGLRPSRLGVQMLDSLFESSWKPIAGNGAVEV
jgi:hypothetical protein